jgi:hypothetical protein
MDCSICFDAITKETGSTTLSCEHVFHFRCIDEWFTKQLLDNLHQTCPCCRSEGAELDRCMYEEVEEDDDYATEEDAESETASDANSILNEIPWEVSDLLWERGGEGRWVVTSRQELAYQSFRSLFGEMNELELEDEQPEDPRIVAARKIQAIFRGNQVRNTHGAAVNLLRLFQQAYEL